MLVLGGSGLGDGEIQQGCKSLDRLGKYSVFFVFVYTDPMGSIGITINVNKLR